MCIEQTMSFRYAGKLHHTELQAVTAALTDIATRIVKEHASNPIQGLIEHGEHVSSLRQRYIHLTRQTNATGEDLQEDRGGPDDGTGE